MSGVWISSIFSNHAIGDKPGTRTKHFGRDWDPAQFFQPMETDQVYIQKRMDQLDRYTRGFALQREDFPEAMAVWNEKAFKKTEDVLAEAGFFVVRGQVAEVLSRFDLGEGGLIPFPVFKADLVTPYGGEYFLLNFGAIKGTILPEQSQNMVKFAVDHITKQQIWKVNSWHEDDEVAVSSGALVGADLWMEEVVDNKIFMSDALAHALSEIGMADLFRLKRCRVLETVQ